MVKEKDTVAFSLRLPADLHEALTRLADADDRSLTKYVTRILSQHVEAVDAKPSKRKADAR